jgi:hypothetical protein
MLHAPPHAPQLLVVVMAVSQPLATLLSQSAKPELHLILHVDPTHVPVPPDWLQPLPQPPQLFASLVVLISQPFPALLSQSAKPELHDEIEHVDPEHASVALFVLHALPQPPQLFLSVAVLTSQPFAPLPSQSAVFATLQLDTSHALFLQSSAAPVIGQAPAHEPQWLLSVAVSISHPFAAFLSQFA